MIRETKNNGIYEYFTDVELTEPYNGYFCSVGDAITIVILGSICGLKSMKEIHLWASNENICSFLKEKFAIRHVPSYSWFLRLLKIVLPSSFNECFMNWVNSFRANYYNETISIDGKTICSTLDMKNIDKPLHIISAQLCECGITLAQRATYNKENEIVAVQELLRELHIHGQLIVADAMNTQKKNR